jgi:peroxiredoxin
MITSNLLTPGDAFPPLTIDLPDGGELQLPFEGEHTVVLLYRGSWCPYCMAQLRAFQRAQDKFAEVGTRVVALSVDDESTTRATIDRLGLTFPVGHGADAREVAAATGALVNPQRGSIESTGFVVNPDGRVAVSVYSSNAIGRLAPDDVIGLIRYMREHQRTAV